MRFVLIVHRYLGVAVGLVMLMWCLSGAVMAYQGYPQLEAADRIGGLEPLRFGPGEPHLPAALADSEDLSAFRIEMMADRPVLRATPDGGGPRVFDLTSGARIAGIGALQALAIAEAYLKGHGLAGDPRLLGAVQQDQWTLDGMDQQGTLDRIALGDRAGTQIYVAVASGEVVQVTTAKARLLSYFGAIPHWLYWQDLRRNGRVWTRVVVWTALSGVFLAATGLYVGILRFRRYPTGRWSPYRGWPYWHHLAGLAAGVLTLTWVASGLLTMNPWGLLETDVDPLERRRLAGTIDGAELKRFLLATPQLADGKLVLLQGASLQGRFYAMATAVDGHLRRLDSGGVETPLAAVEIKNALAAAEHRAPTRFDRLDRPDAYYYSGYRHQASFPVYRAGFADRRRTTVYLDAQTGGVALAIDDIARQGRWWRTGLHDLDFAWLRSRPLWDIVVLALLAGVTSVCATGAWLAVNRVIKDLRRFR